MTSLVDEFSASVSASPPSKKAKLLEAADSNQETRQESAPVALNTTNTTMSATGEKEVPMETDNTDLDTNLYSRQIYALGESAMMHLRNANVLISGVGSVGVEISKNLILAGVRNVTIHDTKTTTWNELSAQYYLTQGDIGVNRATACFEKLAELNDSVNCHSNTDQLTSEFVQKFDLVVLTDATRDLQLNVAQWTRARGGRLLLADARGLFSYVFVDVGENFRVDDSNGEHCKEFHIEHISALGDVTTLENTMHGLEDGNYVTFSELKGMTALNECEPLKVSVKKPHVFSIGEEAVKGLPAHEEGGRARQVKVPFTVNHKSLVESLGAPDYVMWDFAKFDYPDQLHHLWSALYKFEAKHGRSPVPRSDSDVDLLKAELPEGAEVTDKLLKTFAYQASGNLVTVASVVGGIAAQEAMKAVTHHTTPLKQWLYIDHLEALPGDWNSFDNSKLTEADCAPRQTRYDGQAAVFGWPYQEALFNQRWFIVGAGAIGCELLKNFAMMGIGCGAKGLIKITDMDQIEISNLNRQFLFRRNNVGHKKSECAARAVKNFNPDVNIEALAERVGADTEKIFNDTFFEELNGVANALDNVDARRYMDRRVTYYRLPLLESGTMGTKGNTQVVYPYLTESYSSSVDPPEKDIPICTLKNFPHEIQHTIQWARELFEGLFNGPAETANRFLADERGFLEGLEQHNPSQKAQMLFQVKEMLIDNKPSSAKDSVRWARLLFQEHFHNNIGQMLHSFPPDQVTGQGAKFWSGTKRCPHVLNWDPNHAEHLNFVYAASILHSEMYGLKPITDVQEVIEIASAVSVEPFRARAGVKIAVTDEEAREQADAGDDTDAALEQIKLALARLNSKDTPKLCPIDFEKDDDSNHHMEFITGASNLRAENYDIAPADHMKTKQIAGRIIPALATTTATVAGLVCTELFKIIDANGISKTPIESFKNGFINLALPFFGFSEPIAAPKKKYNDIEFTLWDKLELQGPKTMQEMLDWFKDTTGLDGTMVSSGVSLIYSSFTMNAKKQAERLGMEVKQVVEQVSKNPIPDWQSSIVIEVIGELPGSDEDIETPFVVYRF